MIRAISTRPHSYPPNLGRLYVYPPNTLSYPPRIHEIKYLPPILKIPPPEHVLKFVSKPLTKLSTYSYYTLASYLSPFISKIIFFHELLHTIIAWEVQTFASQSSILKCRTRQPHTAQVHVGDLHATYSWFIIMRCRLLSRPAIHEHVTGLAPALPSILDLLHTE